MVVDRAEIPRFEIQSVLLELVNPSADAFGQIDESVWRANLVTTVDTFHFWKRNGL